MLFRSLLLNNQNFKGLYLGAEVIEEVIGWLGLVDTATANKFVATPIHVQYLQCIPINQYVHTYMCVLRHSLRTCIHTHSICTLPFFSPQISQVLNALELFFHEVEPEVEKMGGEGSHPFSLMSLMAMFNKVRSLILHLRISFNVVGNIFLYCESMYICTYMYIHVHVCTCKHQSKRGKAMQSNYTPEDSFFFREKVSCLRQNSNPQHTAYCADALPAELPRQPSWHAHDICMYECDSWLCVPARTILPLAPSLHR